MVWFQCEDCGENLKKPKLPNHFRICSATKLSCIDCGEIFGQQSVQGHNQCITEAEKYGPKGQGGKALSKTPAKANNQSNGKPDVDINVGLSSRAPWYCSLCNTSATSRQTLLLHAEGKKHRAKARALHASKQPPKLTEEATPHITDSAGNAPKEESLANTDAPKEDPLANTDAEELKEQNPPKDSTDNGSIEGTGKKEKLSKKKRKHLAVSENGVAGKKEDADKSVALSTGELIQAKRKKAGELEGSMMKTEDIDVDKTGCTEEAGSKKIKWKKLITSILKKDPNGAIEKQKLESLVVKAAKESCPSEKKQQLRETFMHKIDSSSRFTVDKEMVRLAGKN